MSAAARQTSGCYTRRHFSPGLLCGLLTVWAAAGTAAETNNTQALKSLSVEELMDVKVTSVSKKEEPLSGASAAVSVITQEDIRRSGVETIPDALRMAPGVDVGRVDSHEWAVGVRGFNDTFTSGLLTMIDGRSIYTPLFAGTFWQSQDVLLEDTDRIEVIRGPGAALWGANAFNGVVNVVSKPANETQGLLAAAGGGSLETASTAVRYGGKLNDTTYYRVYGKYTDWDATQLLDGSSAADDWWKGQGGFRIDAEPNDINHLTLQGDAYDLQANQSWPQLSLTPPYSSARVAPWHQDGGNLLGRWTHAFSEDSDLMVQAYYDRADIDFPLLRDAQDTLDLDVRHRFQWGERQEIIWGGGYRLTLSSFEPSYEVDLGEHERTDQIGNLFAQDDLTLVPERLHLILGTKLENNNITGWEVSPSGRLAWTPTEKQTIWASISRAVRTPSIFETEGNTKISVLPPNPAGAPYPTLIEIVGSPNFRSEELLAYEVGYRIQPVTHLSLDATAFVNSYHHLRGTVDSADVSTLPDYLLVRNTTANNAQGETYGTELAATWQVAAPWRLIGSYSFLESDLTQPPSAIAGQQEVRLSAPAHQISLRSSLDVTRNVDLDLWLRWVDQVKNSGADIPGATAPNTVPGYVTLDARLAWRPINRLELSIVGQNLIEPAHREFNPSFFSTQATEVPRSVFGKATLWF